MKKLIRITTVPESLNKLLDGQLSFMKQYYEVIAVSSGGEQLELVKTRQGVRVHSVEMSRKITPLNDLVALFKLLIFLLKEKPFIVHTHTPKAGVIGITAAWLARVPVRLHTVAGLPLLEETGLKRMMLNIIEKFTYAIATKVYPNSHGLQKIILQNHYTDPGKINVILNGSSNGINTREFSDNSVDPGSLQDLKKNLVLSDLDFIYCFIGRMVKDKGINELVEAFVQLYSENQKTRLILVGPFENDLDPLLPSTTKSICSHPGIRFIGFINDVRPYLAISQVLVFPSYREGFPNVVMQAGAMGVPCVVSDINGCNEIIDDGINGIIIPVKNSNAVLKAMREMINQPEQRLQMAKVSREMIVNRYDQHEVWRAILQQYKEFEKDSVVVSQDC